VTLKRVLSAALGWSLVPLLVVAQGVHGQGPSTPTPGGPATPTLTGTATLTITPTATPTPPPTGDQLVRLMKAAVTTKGSVHGQTVASLVETHLEKDQSRVQVDMSWERSLIHEMGLVSVTNLRKRPPKKTVWRRDFRVVGNRQADLDSHQRWRCTSDKSLLQGSLAFLAGFLYVQSAGAQNLGAATFRGVQVWHVRTSQSDPIIGTGSVDPVDLYISQSDYTVLRLRLSGSTKLSNTAVTEHIASDFSNYGEGVHVKLPKACQSRLAQ
jgi:hypothetical protein